MALVMGILLPGFLFSAAEKLVAKDVPETTTPAMEQQIPESTVPTQALTVSVLTDGGVVTEMDMDTYLVGVLLGEMPVEFDTEALKAQAVVARTYTLKRKTTGQKHALGAVCTASSCCQSYRAPETFLADGGTQISLTKVSDAVNSTQNQVLTYNGRLIEATYFSCSGGRTEDAQAVWGTEIPYLQAVDSPGEEAATYFTDTVKYSAREFAALLGLDPSGSPASWLGAVTYTDGGGVDTMVIAGRVYKGTTLRQKLDLRSTVFSIVPAGNFVHIFTRGFGHRVGMSQYGAEAMAVSGSDYGQILAHYYPGAVLDTYLEN